MKISRSFPVPPVIGPRKVGKTTMLRQLAEKTQLFEGTAGKIRLGAMLAYILSLAAFFAPICFEWNDDSSYCGKLFFGAINATNETIFAMILTGLVLVLAIALVITKKPLPAFICGVLSIILFIVLLVLIPDSSPWTSAGSTKQIAIRPGAFLAPVMAAIGAGVSLAGFLLDRKGK